jgi:thymidylate synthase
MWTSPLNDNALIEEENKPFHRDIGTRFLPPMDSYLTLGKFGLTKYINESVCEIVNDPLSTRKQNSEIEIISDVIDQIKNNTADNRHIYCFDDTGKGGARTGLAL